MKLLFRCLSRYKLPLALLIASLIASVFLQIEKTGLVASVVNDATYFPQQDLILPELKAIGLRMLLVALGMVTASVLTGVFAGHIATGVSRDLRERLYSHIMTFSMGEMNRFSIPSVISRCTDDVSVLQSFLYQFLTGALATPILIVGGLVSVWQEQSSMIWILALAVAVVLALFGVMVSRMMPVVRRMVTETDALHRNTRESLSGVQILKALNREAWSSGRISDAAGKLRATNERYSFIEAVILPSMYLVLNLANLLVLWVGAENVSRMTIMVGEAMAIINYLYMIVSGVISGCIIGLQMPRMSVCLKRVQEVLSTEAAVQDPATPAPLPDTFDVAFDDVSFRYAEDGGDVVRHISFTAKQGQVTAIIGNTGCGKTTLMELIPRMYDPREGRVTIGGTDVRDFSLETLRSMVGSVPQRALLFSGTIRSNIALRDPEVADEALARAAELSQSAEIIAGKEEGLEAPIAQGGSNVSGGQRQRLTIARALCGGPRVLLLDDSSSALDYQTDVRLRDAIRAGMADATVIIVSQRISSIRQADQIVVMRDGEIRGIGTHEELKAGCPAYQEILRSQMEAAQ